MLRELTVLLTAILSLCAGMSAHSEGCLVQGGTATGSIDIAGDAGFGAKMAANELQTYIKKMTGAELPIVQGAAGPKIVLRATTGEHGEWGEADAFSIVQKSGVVTILGNSDEATLYGAYQYLQNLGVRWYMPGEIGENVPNLSEIPVGNSEYTGKPSFKHRDIDYSNSPTWHFGDKPGRLATEWELWEIRNKLQFSRLIHEEIQRLPEGIFPAGFNRSSEYVTHYIGTAAIGKADFATEPERWPLVDGKRKNNICWQTQPCLSNRKNMAAAVAAAAEYFTANPQMIAFPLCVEDFAVWCDCPDCVKMNGGIRPSINPNRIYWTFINEATRKIRKAFPGRYISVYAPYLNVDFPPGNMKVESGVLAITTNVSAGARVITQPGDAQSSTYLSTVKRLTNAGFAMGSYDYLMANGTPQPLSVIDTIRIYYDLGFAYYSAENMGRDEQHKIVDWVLAQLAWDATQDPHKLLEEFCTGYYGPVGMDVLKVLYAIDAHVQMVNQVQWGSMGNVNGIMSDDLIDYGRNVLAQAEKKVSGREAERLARFADTFEMYSLTAQAARTVYRAYDNPTDENRRKSLDAVATFGDFWKEHNLDETCSPSLASSPDREWHNVPGLGVEVQELAAPAVGRAADDLATGDKAALMRGLYSKVSDIPESLPNFFMLPEIWKFRLDIDHAAAGNGWLRPECDDSKWREISTYNYYEKQGYPAYDGYFVYRLYVEAPRFPSGKRIYMRIGALDEQGEIYINGRLVHRRLRTEQNAGKTSFAFDVTEAIKGGERNCIAVYGYDGFWDGGIWRPCALYTD